MGGGARCRENVHGEEGGPNIFLGEVFLLTVGASWLTVKLLCLQSLKALIRCTFPLSKIVNCK